MWGMMTVGSTEENQSSGKPWEEAESDVAEPKRCILLSVTWGTLL